MKNKKLFLSIAVVLISTFFAVSAFSVEVYYLGGGSDSGSADGVDNASFSLAQRAKDLVDFGAYGEYGPERSGRISGTIDETISWNSVSGNGEKSFLRRGVDHTTGLNLNVQEKLFRDYQFESQLYLRKTDDRRVDSRKDVRLKQLSTKIYNQDNVVEFGDIYADFSQFVMGSSLEGFNAKISYPEGMKYNFVAARNNEADIAMDQYTKYVYGAKADYLFENDSYFFPQFRLGFQGATSQDDKGSVDKFVDTNDMDNSVFGFDGEAKVVNNLKVEYELAESIYTQDVRAHVEKDTQYGTAFRIKPSLTIDKVNVRYLFYYVDPKFYTNTGSASTDKLQHQVSMDWQMIDQVNLSFVENFYWDKLKGSSRTVRTYNDEQYITLNIRPFDARKSFSARTYVNLLHRNSSDKVNSLESETSTYGVSMNDSMNEGKIYYGTYYEFREYNDLANNNSGSDIYHRVGGNLSFDTDLFGRRLYLGNELSFDFRSTKNDNNPDFNVNHSFNGTYSILDNCDLRFGNNISFYDAAGPGSNMEGNRAFFEAEYRLSEKRDTRCVLRLEENRYVHEDGTQSYKENRAILKFMSNF
ncbi:MAG: hypothetical protein HQL29_02715 [Candidatus Omnitrophica bacterium]|nr:hypothetical protein [Candidatus Omnitrophota bacterium]